MQWETRNSRNSKESSKGNSVYLYGPSVVFNEISIHIGTAKIPWPATCALLTTFLASWVISELSFMARLNQLWALGLGCDSVKDFPPCLDCIIIWAVLKNMCFTYFSSSLITELFLLSDGELILWKEREKKKVHFWCWLLFGLGLDLITLWLVFLECLDTINGILW